MPVVIDTAGRCGLARGELPEISENGYRSAVICAPGRVNINLRRAAAMEAAEAVIETTSSDVKVDALCVTARGIVAVGSKMDGRTWHGEVHRTSQR